MGIPVSQKLGDGKNRCPRALRDGQARASVYATAAKSPNLADSSLTYTHDLVDAPFAVPESGPACSYLACALDVQGLQVTGLYQCLSLGIHFTLFYHLVFCFPRRENKRFHRRSISFYAFTDLSYLTTTPTAHPEMCQQSQDHNGDL